MIVVPSFAPAQHAEEEIVSTLVSAIEGPASPEMANRINAPRDVVDEEDSHQPAPDEAEQGIEPALGNDPRQGRGNQQAEYDPKRREPAHRLHHSVFAKIADVTREIRRVRREHPTHVGVPESLQEAKDAIAIVTMRRVGIV